MGHKSKIQALLVFCILMFGMFTTAALMAQAISADLLKELNYREIGPTRQSGRFVDIAVPAQEPYTIYAATGSGGLWKSINNGITFDPLFTQEVVFAIGAIAIAPDNPNIIWIGSGEATASRSTYAGNGVYKSSDGGKTWSHLGLQESQHIGRIVIDPTNSDIVYVAALGALYSDNALRGLYKTSNGGKTWQLVLHGESHGKTIGVCDVVIDPHRSSTLYAATYDKTRKPWTFNLGGPGSRIYKSTDGGQNWQKLGGGLPEGMLGRIGIDISKQNSQILYATIENANKPGVNDEQREKELLEGKSSQGMIGGEIYRSENGGETWVKVNASGSKIGGNPGYYYGKIIVDPHNDQQVYVLSDSSMVSRDGGKTWQRAFRAGFSGDDHALWIDPANSNHMLLGYDHGLAISYDNCRNWYHPDFLPLAQFYAIGVDTSFPYRIAGGLQDNGSMMGPSAKRGGERDTIKLEDWYTVGGGDGMYNVFDQKTNRFLYNESQFGPLQRVDLVSGERKQIAYRARKDIRFNWSAPVLVSNHNSDTIFHGGNILLKSTNRGESWSEISPDLTTNDPAKLTTGKGGDGNIQHCTITTMDESPLIDGLIWVGCDDGNVQLTSDGGKNWTKLNDRILGNPACWVSRVCASQFAAGTAYVAYSGYRQDDFRAYLYKTTDMGKTWSSIAGNLPASPVNVIREDRLNPNLLYVGTETGVYFSLAGGKIWNSLKLNMPTQPVHDLALHPRENDLIVATHGRGIFILDITPLRELSTDALARPAYLFHTRAKVRWNALLSSNSSSSNFNGPNEASGIEICYHIKSTLKDAAKIEIYKGAQLIDEIPAIATAGLHKTIWRLNQRVRAYSDEEKKSLAQRSRNQDDEMPAALVRTSDPNYLTAPAKEGVYTVVLKIGALKLTTDATILKDVW